MSTYISQLDACPACGAQWEYTVDGKRYSHIFGVYDLNLDRTVAWMCPNCERKWSRNALVVDETPEFDAPEQDGDR